MCIAKNIIFDFGLKYDWNFSLNSRIIHLDSQKHLVMNCDYFRSVLIGYFLPSSANRFRTSVLTRAPLLTKSPQLLFIRIWGVSIGKVHTVHSHPHIPRHTSQRCTSTQAHAVSSWFIYSEWGKKKTFRTRFGHARVDRGGRIKVLSCKIKIQPSSSVRPQGMVRIEQYRRCEMEFASVLTDPCVHECVTAYESK